MLKHFFLLTTSLLSAVCVIEDQCDLEILTPSLQEVQTRKLRLDNELEVYLISDPGARESGAAYAMEVGSWHDPADKPGMAHFCEHVLFLGNAEYPEENGFRVFLDEHGGAANAYTADRLTNYHYRINNDGLLESLKRFSAMFKEPNFDAGAMAREQHAVDQEFARAVENDGWRTELVHRAVGNPKHPASRFGMGNLETLNEISSEEIRGWFGRHYSANLAHLVVYGPQDIETLQEAVIANFSSIPNREYAPFVIKGATVGRPKRITHIVPHKRLRQLHLMWELPYNYEEQLNAQSGRHLSFVLGHEGQKSLLAQLKAEGLAEGIYAGARCWHKPYSENFTFNIVVLLTEEGVSRYEHVSERIFQMIARMQHDGIPHYIHDEIRTAAKLNYAFQTRSDAFTLVSEHARGLCNEPIETYPKKSVMPERFAAKACLGLAEQLQWNNCHMTLVAPTNESGVLPTKSEPWMDSKYTVRDLPRHQLNRFRDATITASLDLPRPNPYLPQDLEIRTGPAGNPQLLVDSKFGRIYYKADDLFSVPQIAWNFTIKSDQIVPGNAASAALLDLYCRAVNERMNEAAYQASLAGISYQLTPSEHGIDLQVAGFSDKALDFLSTMLAALKSPAPSESEFALWKDSLIQSYGNSARETPMTQAAEMAKSVIYTNFVTAEERQEAIRSISYQEAATFCKAFAHKTYIEGTLYGNHNRATAQRVIQSLRHDLQQIPFAEGKNLRPLITSLPNSEGPFILSKKVPSQGQAAILMVQDGPFSLKRRAAQRVLLSALEEPFFTNLRTKQQTGYLVWSWDQEVERNLFDFFAVQSNSHDGRDLIARFEALIEESLRNPLPEQRFEALKQAQITRLSQSPKNPAEMCQRLHQLAFKYNDFDWIDANIDALHNLSYGEFQILSKETLGRTNKRRVALLIQGQLPEESTLQYRPMRSVERLKTLTEQVS